MIQMTSSRLGGPRAISRNRRTTSRGCDFESLGATLARARKQKSQHRKDYPMKHNGTFHTRLGWALLGVAILGSTGCFGFDSWPPDRDSASDSDGEPYQLYCAIWNASGDFTHSVGPGEVVEVGIDAFSWSTDNMPSCNELAITAARSTNESVIRVEEWYGRWVLVRGIAPGYAELEMEIRQGSRGSCEIYVRSD